VGLRKKEEERSIERRLLHNPQKLVLGDLSVAVSVCLVDHFLQLLVCGDRGGKTWRAGS
jgi:hypothetical protein